LELGLELELGLIFVTGTELDWTGILFFKELNPETDLGFGGGGGGTRQSFLKKRTRTRVNWWLTSFIWNQTRTKSETKTGIGILFF